MSHDTQPAYATVYHSGGDTAGQAPTEPRPAGESVSSTAEPMSKSQQKKRLKQQRWQARKAERKAEAKEEKHREAQARHEQLKAKLAQMSDSERLAWTSKRQAVRQERKEQDQSRRARLQDALATGMRIVIDLGFDDQMTEQEIRSLAQQLIYCHSINTKSAQPCHLTFTDFAGRSAAQLCAQAPGINQWIMSRHEAPYHEVFRDRKQDLVYLTADAEEELQALSTSEVYIVGGIIDRNRHKNICQDKASSQGIRTARLPLRQHLQMTGTQILTINQVVALLLKFQQCQSWLDAFLEIVPGRKHSRDAAGEKADNDNCLSHEGTTAQTVCQTECDAGDPAKKPRTFQTPVMPTPADTAK